MKTLDTICGILLIIGGLNWGLWGLFEFDLVASIFGSSVALASKVIYTLVGLSALYYALGIKGIRRRMSYARRDEPTLRRAA